MIKCQLSKRKDCVQFNQIYKLNKVSFLNYSAATRSLPFEIDHESKSKWHLDVSYIKTSIIMSDHTTC